jgi:hypothetical protein
MLLQSTALGGILAGNFTISDNDSFLSSETYNLCSSQ